MSVRRALVAVSVAALSFASFAGCAEDSPSEPQPSTASAPACSPRLADVSWSSGTIGNPVVVGAYRVEYSKDSGRWVTTMTTPVQVDPIWDDNGLRAIAPTAALRRSWESALVSLANRTGQTAGPFGGSAGADLPPDSPATPSKPDSRTWVSTVSVRLFTMPFTIRCGSGRQVVNGTVTAPTFDELTTSLIRCGTVADSQRARVALGFCL